METRIVKVETIDAPIIKKAAQLIRDGEVVAFPTETVYGLGANGLNEEASAKIYRAKGRPSDNPLILHIDSIRMLSQIADTVPHMATEIMASFCPGPVTLIIKKKAVIPDTITGGLDTVGVRMPSNTIAHQLIELAGVPIAAPSANISGRPSPTTAIDVNKDMQGRIPLILDGGASNFGVESTIIDCTQDIPIILRPGAITKEMLLKIFPEVQIDSALLKKGQVPRAPGMKYRHYAPKAPVLLFTGAQGAMPEAFKDALVEYEKAGKKVAVLGSTELLAQLNNCMDRFDYGSKNDLQAIAANLFTGLRYFDDRDVDIILAEGTTSKGIGLAIMNRLKKASGQNLRCV